MTRAACYVRVSTEEQRDRGLSVDNQIQALKEYCEAHNIEIVKIYNDAGISARKSYKKRPALLDMIKDCQAQKIDLILMTKLDRFFRSVKDYYAVMDQIGDVPWKAIWEDYETETSTGVFKVNIMLSVAQSEADRTSERIRNVFEYKKEKGEVCSGMTSAGYIIKNKKWYKDPETQKGIEIFFDRYLSTFKLKESYEYARSRGLTVSYRTASSTLLRNPAYYGGPGYVMEPYITREQFDLIQKNKIRQPKQNKYNYVFTGVCRCALCGCSMAGKSTFVSHKDGTKHRTIQYICVNHAHNYGCSGSTISEKVLENYLMGFYDSELGKYNASIVSESEDDSADRSQALRAKLVRIKNIYELGDMVFDEYKEKRSSIMAELDSLSTEVKTEIEPLPEGWKNIYQELDIEHKNAFWLKSLDHVNISGRTCKKPVIFF